MKYLSLLLFCLALVISQNPNCANKQGKQLQKVYLYGNEAQSFNLGNYFQGYNLQFGVSSASSAFTITQHLNQNDEQIINNTNDYSVEELDIYTSDNLAWGGRAASLGFSSTDNAYFIRYGTLNDKMNVVINNSTKLDINDGAQFCFDVVTGSDRNIIVDCQNVETSTDYIRIYDEASDTTKVYTFPNSTLTSKRKTVPLRISGNRTYLLSAWIGKQMTEQSKRYNSFINIYYLDPIEGPTFKKVVDATALGLTNLSISDITVDPLGIVYVSDDRGTVSQFQYDGTNIAPGQTKNLNTTIYKISVHVTDNLARILHAVGDQYIYQTNLDTDSYIYNYLLPNGAGANVTDFQSNGDVIIAQTTTNYYFYKRHHTSLNDMFASRLVNGTKFALSPRTPHIIIFGSDNSLSFTTSDGFLVLNNSQATAQNVVVTATSQNPDNTNPVTCSAQFVIFTVTQDLSIYTKQDFTTPVSSENPAYEVFKLEDYFVGSQLRYNATGDTGVTLNLQTIQDISINSDTAFSTNFDWFATFTYNSSSYYKTFIFGKTMYIQTCNYNGDSVDCQVSRKFAFTDTILYYQFFTTTLNSQDKLPILSYVTQNNPQNVSFIQLNSDRKFSSLQASLSYNITDIDANERYIYVTVGGERKVTVFKNDLETYNSIFDIDSTTIPYDHTTFYPRQTILSPTDINILIIRNINSIIILKVTAFTHEYVSEIIIDELADESVTCKVVASRSTLLVIMATSNSDDEIRQYGGYDIYNPTEMRTIGLLGKFLALPLQAGTVNGGNLISIRTNDINGLSFLTILRAGQPRVGSILTDIPTNNGLFALLVGLDDSAILEVNAKTTQNLNRLTHTFSTKRYYYKPLLIVRASLDSKFKDTFSFKVDVENDKNTVTIKKSLEVINVKSKIDTSSITPEEIKLPANSNSEETEKQIPADKYFNGPVAKYSLECPFCGNQIKFKPHLTSLNYQTKVKNPIGFRYFEDKNRLWALAADGIHVLDSNFAYINFIEFGLDVSTNQVLNWYFDSNDHVQILFSTNSGRQIFLEGTPSDNRENVTKFKLSVTVQNNPPIKYAQSIKALGNRIFVHDTRLNDIKNGVVHVLTTTDTDGVISIKYETTIDSFSQPTKAGINDFELIDVPGSKNTALFLATLGNIGFAYFSFNTTNTPFATNQVNVYNLSTNDIVESNLGSECNFLQLQVLSVSASTSGIQLAVILTVDKGQHQHLVLKFKPDDNGFFVYESLSQVTIFAKYGKENVLNWATTVKNEKDSTWVVLVGYQGSNYKVSFGVYNLNYASTTDAQQMIAALESDASMAVSNNLAGFLFRDGSTLKGIISSGSAGKGSPQLFSISEKVSIVYKYDERGDFTNIKLIASNQYGSTANYIPIKFDDKPGGGGSGLAWYIILAIVLGGLVVIGLVIFLIVKYKRKKASKDSLLSTSKNQSDDD